MRTIKESSTYAIEININYNEIFRLAENLENLQENSYIRSYPHLLEFFKSRTIFTATDFICGAHMIYGWMPTIVSINFMQPELDAQAAAMLITKAKKHGGLNDNDIQQLVQVINNSLVGTSKLLHFVSPDHFAIMDSKIYKYVFKKEPYTYRLNNTKLYQQYNSALSQMTSQPGFNDFLSFVSDKVGYAISPLRAIELVIFEESKKSK